LETQSLTQILQKFVENKASPEEVRWLFSHFHTESEDQLMKLIMDGFAIDQHDNQPADADHVALDRVYDRLQNHIGFADHKPIYKPGRKIWKFAVAASIIAVASFGGYFLLDRHPESQTAYFKNDISPAHNRATLTLADGKKIILTKGLSGQLAQQAKTSIGINGQSAITYTSTGNTGTIAYNTLSTATGEQSPYPLILADGSKVWLDARSSITFPVAFSGKQRVVKITGEAYFEVFHDNARPFKVIVKNQTVEDIGTHFNISAFDDDKAITTTLLEGAVKVIVPAAPAGVLLKPGQQAVLNGSTLQLANADVEESMAWKNGYFRFNNEDIQSIMLKLSRWYNIDVAYDGAITTEKFYATSSRSKNISEVLNLLQKTKGVHFKIEGRRVTVMQ